MWSRLIKFLVPSEPVGRPGNDDTYGRSHLPGKPERQIVRIKALRQGRVSFAPVVVRVKEGYFETWLGQYDPDYAGEAYDATGDVWVFQRVGGIYPSADVAEAEFDYPVELVGLQENVAWESIELRSTPV